MLSKSPDYPPMPGSSEGSGGAEAALDSTRLCAREGPQHSVRPLETGSIGGSTDHCPQTGQPMSLPFGRFAAQEK